MTPEQFERLEELEKELLKRITEDPHFSPKDWSNTKEGNEWLDLFDIWYKEER